MKRSATMLSALFMAGCAIPPAPRTVAFLDGKNFIVAEPYVYSIGGSRQKITVPAGFVTDYASIPWPFSGYLPSQSRYSRAALIHDYLYWSQRCSRDQADNLLMIAMKESGVGAVKRWTIYGGVTAGGWAAWNGNASARERYAPRVVPIATIGLANTLTWTEAQADLMRREIRDPALPIPAAVCELGNAKQIP